MKQYNITGFEEDGAVFRFTVMADNFSEALKMISEDQYMSDMTFYKLEIEEVNKVKAGCCC